MVVGDPAPRGQTGRRTAMAVADPSHFDGLIGFLKQKRENITFHDIISLAEVAAQSLQGFFQAMDAKVYRELREIAGYIDSMRTEIGALQVNDLKNTRIPSAGEELGAIVKATETATNTIMECAEALMGADASDPAAYKALVDEKMMIIFEACSFQDITGQRIAKVVETLQHIEQRVARFADVMKAKDIEGFLSEGERARNERKEKFLLNGPQLAGEGVDQSDVDKMFA
jgi:chemotaxis protein CheZ